MCESAWEQNVNGNGNERERIVNKNKNSFIVCISAHKIRQKKEAK